LQNGTYDVNNNGPVSTDVIGADYLYPDADYATRATIVAQHKTYEQGFFYFLATDPSVPQTLRNQMNSYGLAPDEFTDNGGWPNQLYVREGRRMVGPYVMTDRNVMGQIKVTDPIALGSYTLDAHNSERYVTSSGSIRNEGDVEISVSTPYGISYRSLTPQQSQASNLLVTSAISATHAGYGSIRMEPVYMELGQAAGTAAALALSEGVAVQQVPYTTLKQQLVADGALVNWPSNIADYVGSVSADFNDFSPLPLANIRYQGGGLSWSGTWDGTNTEKVVAGDLTTTVGGYALQQSGSGLLGKLQGSYSTSRQNYRSLAGQMSGTIWLSFLVNNSNANADCGLSLNPTGNGDPANDTIRNLIEVRGSSLRVTMSGSLTPAVKTLSIGTTHLLLTRLNVDPAGTETVQVWADPANLRLLGQPDYSISGVDLFDYLTKIAALSYNPDNSGNGGYVDAIHISNRSGNQAFIDVTGISPFSGAGTWRGTANNHWGADANWQDPDGDPGTPGLPASTTDTATFSNSSLVTAISLAGANPSLAALYFSGKDYSLSDSTLTLATSNSGSPVITVSDATSQTISSAIKGAQGLLKNGPGTLILAGSSNNFGDLEVDDGTLILGSSGALADGSNVNIGAGASLIFHPAAYAPIAASQPLSGNAADTLSPVPEPGSLMLLGAAGLLARLTMVRRQRRRKAQ
jgi:autotransporter-associated beta strand protein